MSFNYKLAFKKYKTKISNGVLYRRKGYDFLLSFHEYVSLMRSANITPEDIGVAKHKYVLARINFHTGETDVGDYISSNCKFMTMQENSRDGSTNRETSDKQRAYSRSSKPKDHIDKIRAAQIGIKRGPSKKSKCLYCPMECDAGNLKKYHNDNCKHKP